LMPVEDVFSIPYNENGEFDPSCLMTWDLRQGAPIIIPVKGAMNYQCKGKMGGKRNGDYCVVIYEAEGPVSRLLGTWWVDSALKGVVPQIPVVNPSPKKVLSPRLQMNQLTLNPDPVKVIMLPETVKIIQGHHTVLDPETGEHNSHLWQLSLEAASVHFVESVRWKLHKTFRDPIVLCTAFPFQIQRRGWGTFRVGVEINIKEGTNAKETQLISSHMLFFDQEGDSIAFTEVQLSTK